MRFPLHAGATTIHGNPVFFGRAADFALGLTQLQSCEDYDAALTTTDRWQRFGAVTCEFGIARYPFRRGIWVNRDEQQVFVVDNTDRHLIVCLSGPHLHAELHSISALFSQPLSARFNNLRTFHQERAIA